MKAFKELLKISIASGSYIISLYFSLMSFNDFTNCRNFLVCKTSH